MRFLVPVIMALVFAAPAARAGDKIRRVQKPQGIYGTYPSRGVKQPPSRKILPDMDAPRSVKNGQPMGLFPSRNLKLPEKGGAAQGKQPRRIMPDLDAPRSALDEEILQPLGKARGLKIPVKGLKLGDKDGARKIMPDMDAPRSLKKGQPKGFNFAPRGLKIPVKGFKGTDEELQV